MNRGVQATIDFLTTSGIPDVKDQHTEAGENVVVTSTATRGRFQDGAQTLIEQVIVVDIERNDRDALDTVHDTIQELLTDGWIEGVYNMHFSEMTGETPPIEVNSNNFRQTMFFDIKGQIL